MTDREVEITRSAKRHAGSPVPGPLMPEAMVPQARPVPGLAARAFDALWLVGTLAAGAVTLVTVAILAPLAVGFFGLLGEGHDRAITRRWRPLPATGA